MLSYSLYFVPRYYNHKIRRIDNTTPHIAEMGAEKSTLEDRIFELRFSAKQLARDSEKAEKESQKAKKDVAQALKNNLRENA